MDIAAYILLGTAALAFLFAVFFGKPSKDEPMEPKGFKKVWHKKTE